MGETGRNKDTVIFDIDGTLADCDHRRRFLERAQKDWKSFFSHAHLDGPKHDILVLLNVLKTNGYRIILCTGRAEEMRLVTEEWMRKNKIEYELLMMRQSGDYRQDAQVKQEMLDEIGGERILLVVEDRKQAVDMWRKNGLTCLQCAEGNF